MHNLVIDIGNTNHKLAIFKGRALVHYKNAALISPVMVAALLEKYAVKHSVLSSVGGQHEDLVQLLEEKTDYRSFSTSISTGVSNRYETPSTLGLDRWATVIAAHAFYPGESCFIIDAGTCITYDLVDGTAVYVGGSISPGIAMRFEALNHYTKQLPLVDWNREDLTIPDGTNTEAAIKNGVLQGVISEVVGNIHLQNEKNRELKVLITGGDAAFLLEQLKNSIFAPQIIHDPYLVLKGLNEVIAF